MDGGMGGGGPGFAPSMAHPPANINIGGPAVISPDGHTILTVGSFMARLWDATTGKSIGPPVKYEGIVDSVMFSASGRTILAERLHKTVRLWDALTAKPLAKPMTHESQVLCVGFSPDGQDRHG